jgi:hypothetical protein
VKKLPLLFFSLGYPCNFEKHRWQHIPENSLFDLAGNGLKKWPLNKEGIIPMTVKFLAG